MLHPPTNERTNDVTNQQTNSMSRVLLDKKTDPQLMTKFPAFYGNRRFITAFIIGRHLTLS